MAKDRITKQDIIMDELCEQYCEFVAELYNEGKKDISEEEVNSFQEKIRHLIKTQGKNLQLVVKVMYRKGYMKKKLGENTNRKARFLTNVLKNGIEIPSDATYFEINLCPAILVNNHQTKKTDVEILDKQPLHKATIFMGEPTKDYEKVSTGKGEFYTMPEDDPNVFVWENFDTRLISVNEVERTL